MILFKCQQFLVFFKQIIKFLQKQQTTQLNNSFFLFQPQFNTEAQKLQLKLQQCQGKLNILAIAAFPFNFDNNIVLFGKTEMTLWATLLLVGIFLVQQSANMNSSNSNNYIDIAYQTQAYLYNRQNNTQDSCGTLKYRSNYLYHLDKSYNLQIWNNQSFPTPLSYNSFGNLNSTLFQVNQGETQMVVVVPGSPAMIQFYSILQNGTISINSTQTINSSAAITVFLNYNAPKARYYTYFRNIFQNDSITIRSRRSNSVILNHVFNHTNASLTFSSDFKYAVALSQFSDVYIYNATNFVLLHYQPSGLVNQSWITNFVTFNQDCTLLLVEYDNYADIRVINLTDFSQYASISYSDKIYGSIFLSNQNILIFGNNQTPLWDISICQFDNSFDMQATVNTFAINYYDGTVYTCSNNIVSFFNISGSKFIPSIRGPYVPYVEEDQLNITNASSFWKIVNLTDFQKQIYGQVDNALTTSSQVILQKAMIFATSLPLTFYFLTFINFLDFTCIYLFLNIQIPELVFKSIEKLYFTMSTDPLESLGVGQLFSPITTNRVEGEKLRYFGFNSDILWTNYLTIALILVNIAFAQILNYIGYKLKISNAAKHWLIQDRLKIISGQIIKIMIPCTSIWKFMIYGEANSIQQRINCWFWYLLFGLSFLFPFIFLMRLAKRNSAYHLKSEKINVGRLLTGATVEQGCDVAAHFLYPFFVLFDNTTVFLAIIGIYCMLRVLNTFRINRWKINCFILSLYPLLFHCCFIIFYYSEDNNILANASIITLFTILVGSIHCLLTICADTIYKMYKILSKYVEFNRVTPASGISQITLHKKQSSLITQQIGQQNKWASSVKQNTQFSHAGKYYQIFKKMETQKIKNNIKIKTLRRKNLNTLAVNAKKLPVERFQ